MATPEYKVYEGLWTNLSNGPVKGITLTLSQTKAAYLIAFLALYVHLSGASFWRFTSFALFRTRAHLTSKDKITLQQQAILRNGPSAITALSNLVKAALRSKGRWDNVALSAWALANFVFFLAAGILSSKVANTQPDVLLQSTICGRWWQYSLGSPRLNWLENEKDLYNQAIQSGAVRDLHLASSRFKSACYDNSKMRPGCLWFVREPISWSSALGPGCAFGDDICINNTTFTIQSEWIDSDRHLGINAARKDRLSLQIRNTCSPIKRDGYFESYDSSNITKLASETDNDILAWWWNVFFSDADKYGAFLYGSLGAMSDRPYFSATFIHSNATRTPIFNEPSPAYSLSSAIHQNCTWEIFNAGYCSTSFLPIPALRTPDRDMSLIFLTSTIDYCGAVTDPWFDAQACNKSFFHSDWAVCKPAYPTSTLACAEEIEICVGTPEDNGRCVKTRTNGLPFEGMSAAGLPNITRILNLNSRQAQIAERIQDTTMRSQFAGIIEDMGAMGMLAYSTALTAECAPVLPSNQWTKEIENWFTIMLLNIQLYNTQYVTGWSNKQANEHITPPPADATWMCDAQIVQNEMYTNFSVVGILLILLLGGTFIALRLCLPWLVHTLQLSSTENEHRRTTWKGLNLPEMASELFEKQLVASRVTSHDDESTVSPISGSSVSSRIDLEKR